MHTMKGIARTIEKRATLGTIVLGMMLAGVLNSGFAKTITSVKSGEWGEKETWDCNCEPKKSDNVIIATNTTVILDDDVNTNDITIALGGILDVSASNFNIHIEGNWTNNGTFVQRAGKVKFKGDNTQAISGTTPTTFYELEIHQKKNAQSNIVLNSPVMITNNLNLKKGVIHSNMVNYITIKTTGDMNGGSQKSFINGPVKIETDIIKEIVIDTGKNGKHKKTKIQTTSSDPTTFMAEYYNTSSQSTSSLSSGLAHICDAEYWKIQRVSGTAGAAVTLSWDGSSCGQMQNTTMLRVARFDGNQWADEGNTTISGSSAKGSITSNTLNGFGDFTFGCNHGTGKSAYEGPDNFQPYEVEAIGALPLADEFAADELGIYAKPNPSNKSAMCIDIVGKTGQEVLIMVVDMLGREHYSKICLLETGKLTLGQDPTDKLAPGVYMIIASSKNKFENKKIIIR